MALCSRQEDACASSVLGQCCQCSLAIPSSACARMAATTASTLLWLRNCRQQEHFGWEHALTLCCVLCRAWHIISHPLAINPFPASYLNCRTGFTIAPVTIPGNQGFMDWKLTMLTELHAMDNMKAILGGMMRVGMLSKHFSSCVAQFCDPRLAECDVY